ncbi:MAG: rod shape-determining protein [Bacillota bacterium]|nr:rod shape-determining protein [Bacillota bacterium]
MTPFFMSKDVGIDLGTTNTLVYMTGKGIVLREPSVVAVSTEGRRGIIAIGEEARVMLGRTPGSIAAIRPLRDGVIANLEATESMLKYFIRKAVRTSILGMNPRIAICVPCGVTEVEKRTVEEAARSAGARDVMLVDEPMAAALGAGLDIHRAHGCMVVDIGGGTCETAVISLGGIVTCKSLRVAGNKMDEAITLYIKKKYGMVIGERTAEELKIQIGSLAPAANEATMETRGRDMINGLPVSFVISSAEVREALMEPALQIVESVRQVLENTPPELSADILESGITLTGGGALLRGMAQLLSGKTGVRVKPAGNPLDCVALGSGRALEEMMMVKRTLEYSRAETV